MMEEWHYQPTADFDQSPLERLAHLSASAGHARLRRASGRCTSLIRAWLRDLSPLPHHRPRASAARPSVRAWWPITPAISTPSRSSARCRCRASRPRIRPRPRITFSPRMPKIAFSAVVMNAMPFDRKESPRDSLALCRELLVTPGHVLIIFPEGTRSHDRRARRIQARHRLPHRRHQHRGGALLPRRRIPRLAQRRLRATATQS